jgi:hypothetical protein
VTLLETSRYVSLATYYEYACVGAGWVMGGGTDNKSYPLRRMSLQYRVKRNVLQVWPIPTSMLLGSKRRQNTLNNTD